MFKCASVLILSITVQWAYAAPPTLKDQIVALGFENIAIPEAPGEAWMNLIGADISNYKLSINDGLLSIKTELDYSPVKFDTEKIKYIGSNHGEFGGKLEAEFSHKKLVTLIEDNVVAIEIAKVVDISYLDMHRTPADELYVFTGLAHLNTSKGAIYRINDYETSPKASLVTLLFDAPEFVLIQEDHSGWQSFYIVGTNSLSIYNPNFNDLKILLSDLPWRYPTSALIYENQLIVAAREALVVVNLNQLQNGAWRDNYKKVSLFIRK